MPCWQLKHRSGEFYSSNVVAMTLKDSNTLSKLGWEKGFDWRKYFNKNEESDAYKLVIVGQNAIQGAIAHKDAEDHVYIDLLESSPANRYINKQREFVNVADILLGAACLRSLEIGAQGFIAFTPKTKLYDYYKKRFKAKPLGRAQMYLDDVDAQRLIGLYYK